MRRRGTPRSEVRDARSTQTRRKNLGRAAALTAFAAVLAGCSSDSDSNGNAAEETTGNTFAASTSDDWFAAVCKPGSFLDGQGGSMLPSSDQGSAICMPRQGTDQIGIGLYSSRFKAENDVVGQGPYATMETAAGYIQVFALFLPRSSTAALQPLTEFGFELHPAVPY